MIKLALLEHFKHRSETTFRPLINCAEELAALGEVKLTSVFDRTADIYVVSQASLLNKDLILSSAVELGVKYLKLLGRPYIIWDGQDSTSLKGIADIIRMVGDDLNYMGTIKNGLLKETELYKQQLVSGRFYWGVSKNDGYAVPDVDYIIKSIKLSGTNWLSTTMHHHQPITQPTKNIDINIVFSYENVMNLEFGINHGQYYSQYRLQLVDAIRNIQRKHALTVVEKPPGAKYNVNEYYELMSRSRILFAPFGYGELAPRDIESAIMGCVLFKPDEYNKIDTKPNVLNNKSCVFYTLDNLEEKILTVLDMPDQVTYPTELLCLYYDESNRSQTAKRLSTAITSML